MHGNEPWQFRLTVVVQGHDRSGLSPVGATISRRKDEMLPWLLINMAFALTVFDISALGQKAWQRCSTRSL